ncbi:MAG: hypothetical protein K0R10_2648 [Alphaproteobacteria bacterium]|nr:hypothetical protein [Alphaproteobacteria bacterium]
MDYGHHSCEVIVRRKNVNSTETKACRRCRLPLISDSPKGDDSDLCDHCRWEMSLDDHGKDSRGSKSV